MKSAAKRLYSEGKSENGGLEKAKVEERGQLRLRREKGREGKKPEGPAVFGWRDGCGAGGGGKRCSGDMKAGAERTVLAI